MVSLMLVRSVVVAAVMMITAGAWSPTEARTDNRLAGQQVQHVNSDSNPKELSPSVMELKRLIENNTVINMLFSQMLDTEVPYQRPFRTDPLNHTEIRDYHGLLRALDRVITEGPEWSNAANKVGLDAAPIVTFLDYPMATPAGYAAFLEPEVNKAMQNILIEWGRFLTGPQSATVLNNKQGWFSRDALTKLMETANAPYKTNYTFGEFYQSDPAAKYYGFKSWDNFFTRQFRPEVRPVHSPDDDNVIANACESKPFNVSTNVQLRSRFWIKRQPYSVQDILAFDDLADQFAGGTLYQAYLSALSYHRWHSPVNGKVVKAFVKNGTYFSVPLFQNRTFDYEIAPHSLNALNSQEYLAALATRGIIFIEADNPAIGLMAFVAVGNYEVSTIDIRVREGQRVKKGEEMGMFHFGGSSYVALFRPGVKLEGLPSVEGTTHNLPVRGQLAVVKP